MLYESFTLPTVSIINENLIYSADQAMYQSHIAIQ